MKTWKEIIGAAAAAALSTAVITFFQYMGAHVPPVVDYGTPASCAYAVLRAIRFYA